MFCMCRNDGVQQVGKMSEQAMMQLIASNEMTIEDCSDSESTSDSTDDGERVVWLDLEYKQIITLSGGQFGIM